MTFDLRPSLLDDLGLLPAIGWYAETRLKTLGVKVHVEVDGDERRIEPEVETALFRIIQEAITNVAKHAEAENLAVNLDFREAAIYVEIEDDGKGFEKNESPMNTSNGEGFGLLGMRERVSLLGGTIEIDSRLGEGTRLQISVPCGKEVSDVADPDSDGGRPHDLARRHSGAA